MLEKATGENRTDTAESSVPSEIRKDLGNVKAEVNQLMTNLQEFSQISRQEIQDMKSIVDRTYNLVVDTRYKVIQMLNVYPFVKCSRSFSYRVTFKSHPEKFLVWNWSPCIQL